MDHPIDSNVSFLHATKTPPNALEEILQPLIDLLNQQYRGNWEGEYAICRNAAFKPLNDPNCALIELPLVPTEYPEVAQGLTLLLALSETCPFPYRGRPEGDGPVCGPCRFSVAQRALGDGWFDYVHGTHLLVERRDLSARAAKAQVAYLDREMRNYQDDVPIDHGAF